jgi:membrane-associated phospholipid phosphatase
MRGREQQAVPRDPTVAQMSPHDGLVLALAVTALMATSRLYLADHWLTDILASTALAFGVTAVMALLDTYLATRFPSRSGGGRPVATLPGLSASGR